MLTLFMFVVLAVCPAVAPFTRALGQVWMAHADVGIAVDAQALHGELKKSQPKHLRRHRHAAPLQKKRGALAQGSATPNDDPTPPAAATHDEAVEPIENVEVVDAAKTDLGQVPQGPQPTPWLAHLHPALVHLPIAWLVLLTLLEALAVIVRRPNVASIAPILNVFVVLSFAPSILSGLSRYSELSQAAQYDQAPALLHRNLLYVALGLCVVSMVLRLSMGNHRSLGLRHGIYISALFLATAVTAYSAHLGGAMVYGDDFLPFFGSASVPPLRPQPVKGADPQTPSP